MNEFNYPLHLRWADMDPNFHLRHDVYYAIGAQVRIEALASVGITNMRMQEGNIGPIIFREECIFKREIRLGQKLVIDVKVSKARADASRWAFRHEIQRDDGTLCAVMDLDGAWLDTRLRKLAIPPRDFATDFLKLPRTEDFEMQPVPAPKPA